LTFFAVFLRVTMFLTYNDAKSKRKSYMLDISGSGNLFY